MRSPLLSLLATTSIISFIWGYAATAAEFNVGSLPRQGDVTVSGKVEKVSNAREFTLRDPSGTINVTIASNESEVLKPGDDVTVNGIVETGFFGGKDIKASKVDVRKDLSTALGDAVTKATGLTLDQQATTVQVGSLPNEGMVHLTGKVDDVKNAKDFTLKDATGTVGVTVESSESAALVKGAEVSVVGYVYNGMLGKAVRATHVAVTADSTASAAPAR